MAGLTPTEFRDAYLTALNTYWAGRTPVAWPNKPFDPETVGEADDDAYIQPQFLPVPEVQEYIGASGYFRRAGSVAVHVLTRSGTGTDKALELADLLMAFFEDPDPDVAEAIFNNVNRNEIGGGGAWYQVSVTADYLYFTDRGN
jgi:hypothetical protein